MYSWDRLLEGEFAREMVLYHFLFIFYNSDFLLGEGRGGG